MVLSALAFTSPNLLGILKVVAPSGANSWDPFESGAGLDRRSRGLCFLGDLIGTCAYIADSYFIVRKSWREVFFLDGE